MVEFSIFLYWKPCPDMGIEGERNFDPKILKEFGQGLKKHLEETSETLMKLKENGWDYSGGLYDVMCYKDISLEEAEKELQEMGLDIKKEHLMQLEE